VKKITENPKKIAHQLNDFCRGISLRQKEVDCPQSLTKRKHRAARMPRPSKIGPYEVTAHSLTAVLTDGILGPSK
jgi:hypothetical protein